MYSLGNIRFGSHDEKFNEIVSSARRDRLRPSCRCMDDGAPVYIAKLAGTYVLKRMPGTGRQHALGCPHRENEHDLSRSTMVPIPAVWVDPDTGITHLRLGFELSKSMLTGNGSTVASISNPVAAQKPDLSLRGLLEFLWSRAGLMQWRPEFAGKRNWAVVRYRLLSAAVHVQANGRPLPLLIPEAFSVEKRGAIEARRNHLLASLTSDSRRRALVLLVGEIKELRAVRGSRVLSIRHLPDQRFSVKSRSVPSIDAGFAGGGFANWRPSQESRRTVIATVDWKTSEPSLIEDMSVVQMSTRWTPTAQFSSDAGLRETVRYREGRWQKP